MTTTTAVQGSIGARFRALRQSRGLSVHALAHLAGVSSTAIVLLERYELAPKSKRVRERLAHALGVDAQSIFGNDSQEVEQG